MAHPELLPALVAEASRRLVEVSDATARTSAGQYVQDAQAQLEATNRQLAVANDELQAANAQLQAANAQLQAADAGKNRFLAMLAPELRNPLMPILNAVQFLKTQGPAEAGLERSRAIIERQTRHQARLINGLLDVARVTQGKIQLRLERVDFVGCLREGVEHGQTEAQTKGLTVQLHAPAEPLPVRADPDRLQQVITNLFNNALRYTPAPGEVTLSASREGQLVALRVRDTGIGIEPELLPRIFGLFTQADRSLDRPSAGLGIGLSLAHALTRMHGGQLEAHSDGPGQGSEFILRWPLVTDSVGLAPPSPAPSAAPALCRQILVIEDNIDALQSWAELLEGAGHTVLTATDGETALRLAIVEAPECYVIDLRLPGMNGYELVRRLRELPTACGARFIALTGYGTPEDKQRACDAGFHAHLTKPADLEQLQQALAPSNSDVVKS